MVKKDVVELFPDKEINITVQLELSVNQSIIIANELLSEVFLNIFTNAIKFSPGPQVKINIIIDKFTKDQEFIRVRITDFGQGITPEVKELLFDRAALTKSGWKPNKGSTGLGMTIIKSLVDFFGGDISYQNRVKEDWKRGTTIVLIFPLAIQSVHD